MGESQLSGIQDYRYPGSRPFQDRELDSLLFHGREDEKQRLLHRVLSERLVTVFSKSGLGKSSLLNAGLAPLLRTHRCFPVVLRLNKPEKDILELIYDDIEHRAEEFEIDLLVGEKRTLWEYFKTSEFWSKNDELLSPILIFDQFEEIFTLYSQESRNSFVAQLANVIRGIAPPVSVQSDHRTAHLSDDLPDVRVVIALREDFLAHIDDLSTSIPAILQNRFRLNSLQPEAVRKAIVEPAKFKNQGLLSEVFSFEPKAVDTIIRFLQSRPAKRQILGPLTKSVQEHTAGEIEPFQLQLICQDIEAQVLARQRSEEEKHTPIVISDSDLKGEQGMRKVLENFYVNQLARVPHAKNEAVRKLCEKGLISRTNRRVSLDEEIINDKYKVSPDLLAKLVDYRLLRAEPRLGSTYFELSHDNFVDVVQQNRRVRMKKKVTYSACAAIVAVSVVAIGLLDKYQTDKNYYQLYKEGQKLFNYEYDVEGSIEKFKLSIAANKDFVEAYVELGEIYEEQSRLPEALDLYEHAIPLIKSDPQKFHRITTAWAKVYLKNRDYESSLERRDWGLADNVEKLSPWERREEKGSGSSHVKTSSNNLSLMLGNIEAGDFELSLNQYINTIGDAPELAYYYAVLREALSAKNEQSNIRTLLKKVLELTSNVDQPNHTALFVHAIETYYTDLAKTFYSEKQYEQAAYALNEAIELIGPKATFYGKLAKVYLAFGQVNKTEELFNRAVRSDPKLLNLFEPIAKALIDIGEESAARSLADISTESFSDPDLVFEFGEKLANLKFHKEAETQFRQALEIGWKDAYEYISPVERLVDYRKYKLCVAYMDRAIFLNPNEFDAHYWRGDCQGSLGHFDKAIADFSRALELFGSDKAVLIRRGSTYPFIGENDKALGDYNKAIELDENYIDAYIWRASLYSDIKEFEKALQDLNKILEIDPGYRPAHNNLATLYIDLGDFDRAIESLNKLIETYPDYYLFYKNKALAGLLSSSYRMTIEITEQGLRRSRWHVEEYLINVIQCAALKQLNEDDSGCEAALAALMDRPLEQREISRWTFERLDEWARSDKANKNSKMFIENMLAYFEKPEQ